MRKTIFLSLLLCSFFVFAQTPKKSPTTNRRIPQRSISKTSTEADNCTKGDVIPKSRYSVRSLPMDSAITKGRAALVVKFIGVDGHAFQIHRSMYVGYTINADSFIPALSETASFKSFVRPKNCKFNFFVKLVSAVNTDSILLQKNTVTYITVAILYEEQKFPAVLYALDKPVIYVYPEETIKIKLQLDVKGEMVFSYPKYNEGWSFTAQPSGNIKIENKNFNYLFWEGSMKMADLPINAAEGFIVGSDSLVDFFEVSLAMAGLNEKETQDFITYWVPKMKAHDKNYVHFMFTQEYDYFATIKIDPPPKNLIRVFVIWSPLASEKNYSVYPQIFPPFSRSGYTVIEWGGSEIENFLENIK